MSTETPDVKYHMNPAFAKAATLALNSMPWIHNVVQPTETVQAGNSIREQLELAELKKLKGDMMEELQSEMSRTQDPTLRQKFSEIMIRLSAAKDPESMARMINEVKALLRSTHDELEVDEKEMTLEDKLQLFRDWREAVDKASDATDEYIKKMNKALEEDPTLLQPDEQKVYDKYTEAKEKYNEDKAALNTEFESALAAAGNDPQKIEAVMQKYGKLFQEMDKTFGVVQKEWDETQKKAEERIMQSGTDRQKELWLEVKPAYEAQKELWNGADALGTKYEQVVSAEKEKLKKEEKQMVTAEKYAKEAEANAPLAAVLQQFPVQENLPNLLPEDFADEELGALSSQGGKSTGSPNLSV